MRYVEPTGRWRHREHRGRLVLQIEERGLHTDFSYGVADSEWVTRWRDATAADVTLSRAPTPEGAGG